MFRNIPEGFGISRPHTHSAGGSRLLCAIYPDLSPCSARQSPFTMRSHNSYTHSSTQITSPNLVPCKSWLICLLYGEQATNHPLTKQSQGRSALERVLQNMPNMEKQTLATGQLPALERWCWYLPKGFTIHVCAHLYCPCCPA